MNARLALLGTVTPGATESEVFRLALGHAVGELGALGGTMHLRGPMSALRLVSSAGLPAALTRSWEIVDQEGPWPRPARSSRARASGYRCPRTRSRGRPGPVPASPPCPCSAAGAASAR